MFRKALRLFGNKKKVARYLYSCPSMFRTALRMLGNKWKVTKYLYSCFDMARSAPIRLLYCYYCTS